MGGAPESVPTTGLRAGACASISGIVAVVLATWNGQLLVGSSDQFAAFASRLPSDVPIVRTLVLGLVIGYLGWVLLIERRLPWPLSRKPLRPVLPWWRGAVQALAVTAVGYGAQPSYGYVGVDVGIVQAPIQLVYAPQYVGQWLILVVLAFWIADGCVTAIIALDRRAAARRAALVSAGT
jgi:hypothetical protein